MFAITVLPQNFKALLGIPKHHSAKSETKNSPYDLHKQRSISFCEEIMELEDNQLNKILFSDVFTVNVEKCGVLAEIN